MKESSIPIFKKTYDFYKEFYGYLKTFPRSDRYSLGQRCELHTLEIIECIILASQLSKKEKLPILEKASLKLDILRILIRLAKEIKALDNRKYLSSQKHLDEIGRMLGGWIKSTKSSS